MLAGWSRSRAKKRAVSDDHEQIEEVPMDAQSPGGSNESGAAETPPGLLEPPEDNPPKADAPRPLQELKKYSQSLDKHKKETDEALHLMDSVCKENEEKAEAIEKLTAENSAVRKELEIARHAKQDLEEKLKHQNGEMYQLKIQLESARRSCFELTEEKRKTDKIVAQQSADLQANQQYIANLSQQLKDADGESKRMAVVLSRKHALELEVKDKKACLKDAQEQYRVQLEISGSFSEKARVLEEQNAQLTANLEHVQVKLSAAFSELERLKCEVQDQKAKEEGQKLLLREKEKEISELKQACDACRQHLEAVAPFATTSVDPARRSVAQQPRYNLRCRHKTQENAAAGVFSMDESGVCDETFYPASHPQIPSTAVPEFLLTANDWPPPSAVILSHFAGRIAPKWYELAHALGVGTEADSLLQTEHSTERKCFLCLKAWINNGPEVGCSWKSLFHELCSFQLHAVAKDIHDELQKTAFTNHSI